MSIIQNSSLTRRDIRVLGNNLSDAICDRSDERRRHCLKMIKALDAYCAVLRAQRAEMIREASIAWRPTSGAWEGVPARVGVA
jgi:hypothetical protein